MYGESCGTIGIGKYGQNILRFNDKVTGADATPFTTIAVYCYRTSERDSDIVDGHDMSLIFSSST